MKYQWRNAVELGRALTPAEQLENLCYLMTHCFKCDAEVVWGAPVCETCGEELVEFGKN